MLVNLASYTNGIVFGKENHYSRRLSTWLYIGSIYTYSILKKSHMQDLVVVALQVMVDASSQGLLFPEHIYRWRSNLCIDGH